MRANKTEGYGLLIEAAKAGHREARAILAWARLLGSRLGPTYLRVSIDDIPSIFEIFKELADTGLPSAHMVSGEFILIIVIEFRVTYPKIKVEQRVV